ncbi:hypothetical protein PSN13_03813 [Micromonospora saelicesensis]|uniref:Uncharacterized protein n=1 Tax=Micromonospora saelicesensis TaxID=285676 RepID=A0A328NJB9_9ACTN|nr:hypothetical protein PSN13_03813 [Micromonospora saelicesensis]
MPREHAEPAAPGLLVAFGGIGRRAGGWNDGYLR